MIGKYKTIILKTLFKAPQFWTIPFKLMALTVESIAGRYKLLFISGKVIGILIMHVTDCRSITKNSRKWSPKIIFENSAQALPELRLGCSTKIMEISGA